MPAVSVILPTRHRPALLKRAVDSILEQTFTDFEIVVVDNNPKESCVASEACHPVWLRDKRIVLVKAPGRRNAAAVRNVGLLAARGDWCTYLDDDDAYHPRKIERQWQEALDSQLPVGLCQLRFCVPLRRRVRGPGLRQLQGDELLLCFPGMPAIFHRRAPTVRFNEALDAGEDMHYFQQLLRHFKLSRVFHVPQPLVDVYVQQQAHVNLNAVAGWKAATATLRDFGATYSAAARCGFLLQARLGYCKREEGTLGEMLAVAGHLLRQRHFRDSRLILNCFLFKLRCARRWLVV